MYVAIATRLTRGTPRPQVALRVGAVVTGTACALGLAAGLGYGTTPLEAGLTAAGGAVVLSASLLAGSEALCWTFR